MKKLLHRFCRWVLSDDGDNCYIDSNSNPDKSREMIRSDGFTFNVYIASGGIVIELTEYDTKTDRYNNKLFVTQQEEFGRELEHILMVRLLQQR